jgi:hypothetical protein
MIKFKQFFEQNIVSPPGDTTALLPGGFKPPTKGHVGVLEELLSGASNGVVFVGKGDRDGITQDMSAQIWEIYAPYISKPIKVVKSPISPVKSVYDYIEERPTTSFIVGAGAPGRGNAPEGKKLARDIDRYASIQKNKEKYPYVIVKEVAIQGDGISGTEARRKIMNGDSDAVDYFAIDGLSESDKERIKAILNMNNK